MTRRRFLLRVLFLVFGFAYAQIPPYYNDVDLTLRGAALKDELAAKIISTHTNYIDYDQLWWVLKLTDEVPYDTTRVFLIYGWENGTDGDCHNDLTRDKDANGGSASRCEWNREHVFPRSLAEPDLGSSGAGSDPHHVRACDVSMNGRRGNKKFIDASGHAGTVNGDFWYPGDQWKGDVARIIMYLYLRYGTQCLPRYVGEGNPVSSDPDMVDFFLEWNAEDPPSETERRRNAVLENLQGNRNPFIDNPYLATLIWGGPPAQDTWNLDVSAVSLAGVRIYPVPADKVLYVESPLPARITVGDMKGTVWRRLRCTGRCAVPTDRFPAGVYWIRLRTDRAVEVRKFVKQ
ncbi:MAG: T9SS type A sorting domain-containing protein [Chlorobi bacterium]|nr:T9SS type A sorting domain-containing protein [Chlorobiota bacterium]